MALPKVLKKMHVFADAVSWFGETNAITLPNLGRQMEEYRGSFSRPIKIDLGGTALELEIKKAGLSSDVATKIGQTLLDGNTVRFAGAYQSDDTGEFTSVEVYMRGRVEEVARGEQKVGAIGEETIKYTLTYYREVANGQTLVEIDILNNIEMVNGVDIDAEARAIVGL